MGENTFLKDYAMKASIVIIVLGIMFTFVSLSVAETWIDVGKRNIVALAMNEEDLIFFHKEWSLYRDDSPVVNRYTYAIAITNFNDSPTRAVRLWINFENAFGEVVFIDKIDILEPIPPIETGIGYSVLWYNGKVSEDQSHEEDMKASLFRDALEKMGPTIRLG